MSSLPIALDLAPRFFFITKVFLEGTLRGLAVRELTSVAFVEGRCYGGGFNGPRYLIQACEQVSRDRAEEIWREGSLEG